MIGKFSSKLVSKSNPKINQSITVSNPLWNLIIYQNFLDFFVVDARYPYEFNGGHIRGARNLYTKDQVHNHFYGPTPAHAAQKENPGRRQITIFHCEFSVERGPSMLRYLRKTDRLNNRYPALDYPELYILKGGYKQFFADHREATTGSYAPMLDTKYTKELRHFRRKCKTLPAGKLIWSNQHHQIVSYLTPPHNQVQSCTL